MGKKRGPKPIDPELLEPNPFPECPPYRCPGCGSQVTTKPCIACKQSRDIENQRKIERYLESKRET